MNTTTRAIEIVIAGEHSLLFNLNSETNSEQRAMVAKTLATVRATTITLGLTFDNIGDWVDPEEMVERALRGDVLFLKEIGTMRLSSALVALSGKCVIATNSDGSTCFRAMFDLIHNQGLIPEDIPTDNILRAKSTQAERGTPNGKLLMNDMRLFMDSEARKMLEHLQPLNTEYIRLLRVAHTIADLDGKKAIDEYVMSEALAWRGHPGS